MSVTVLVRQEREAQRGQRLPEPSLPGSVGPALTFDAPRIVLGRGEGCEVRIPDVSVSHRHATLRQRGAEYLLVDEGSTNGTRLGRVRLAPHSPRVIQNGDVARIGRVWVEFRIDGAMPTRGAPVAAKEQALHLVQETLRASGEDARPCITVEEGPPGAAGTSVRIDRETHVVIGRSSDAQLVIDDPDLSRRHAEIFQRGDLLVVRDLGSKVGTRIADRSIGASEVVWRPGERLAIGGTAILTYTFPAVQALAEIESSPDEKVPALEIDTWHAPSDVVPAPAEPIGEMDDAGPDGGSISGDLDADVGDFARRIEPARRVRWGVTDLAVVMLALGVLSLSAVGYFVLLR